MSDRVFAEWEPPLKPEPEVILDEAREDARAGRYEDALAKHLWFHRHALEYQQALYGVRLSFALGCWVDLGKVYPAALDELRRVRDQVRQRVLTAKEDIRESFHDMSSINKCLGEEKQTVEVFLALDKKSPKLASTVYRIAEPDLTVAKEYKACGKYLTPEETIARLLQIYQFDKQFAAKNVDRFKEMRIQYAENSLTDNGGRLIALLVVNDRKSEAEKIAAQIKKETPNEARNQVLDAALKGEFPKTSE